MANAMLAWLVAIPFLGLATGLRTLTPMAVLCWFAYMAHLPVRHSWAFWTANLISVAIFTLLAVGEDVGDKLPKTPNRTAPLGLATRLVFGGLVGAIAATALKGAALEGIILGALGALLGTFVGYHLRRDLVQRTGAPDGVIAVCEDSLAVVMAIFALRIITT